MSDEFIKLPHENEAKYSDFDIHSNPGIESEIRKTFQTLDKDGNGFLSKKELIEGFEIFDW